MAIKSKAGVGVLALVLAVLCGTWPVWADNDQTAEKHENDTVAVVNGTAISRARTPITGR